MTDDFNKTLENKPNSESRQFLTFSVNNEEYGVDIMSVREIKGWTETTRLPNSPEHMRGVMNLRGLIIPIFDLRARFSGVLTKASDKNVIIILAIANRNIGVLVDSVSDILTISQSEVKPAPEGESNIKDEYISGLISTNNRMVVLLCIHKLFGNEKVVKEAEGAI